ncbi:MAG: hypothetical protein M3Z85_14625, partial [Acidobacteriota bacterium]|nr:hypothetical protein [Acidobacteriota bacterium]
NGMGQAGFVYLNDRLTSEPDVTNMYLSRIDPTVFPYSQAAYINASMGAHIIPAGWLLNNAAMVPDVRFWEYNSTDPDGTPLDVSKRAAFSRQLTKEEAVQWSDPAFVLGGWVPDTVNATAATANPGAPLVVNWSAAAGHASTDTIGLYISSDPDSSPLSSQQIGSANTGRLTFTMPATPGGYDFRLIRSNVSTRVAASGRVAVQ